MEAAADGDPLPANSTLEISPRETRVLGAAWVYEPGVSELTWTPEGSDGERTLRDVASGPGPGAHLPREASRWNQRRRTSSAGFPCGVNPRVRYPSPSGCHFQITAPANHGSGVIVSRAAR